MGGTSSSAGGGLGFVSDEKLRADVAVKLHSARKTAATQQAKDVRPTGRKPMPSAPKRPDPHSDRKAMADAFRAADQDKDGMVIFSEFKEAAKDVGFKTSDIRLKEAFNRFDKDKNGRIDVKEYLDFMSPLGGLQVAGIGLGISTTTMSVTSSAVQISPASPTSPARKGPQQEKKVVEQPAASLESSKVLAKVARAVYERELSLQKAFQRWDADGSGSLDLRELKKALDDLGFALGADGLRTVFAAFDVNGDGRLSCWELVQGLSGLGFEQSETKMLSPRGLRDEVLVPTEVASPEVTGLRARGGGKEEGKAERKREDEEEQQTEELPPKA
ncbi:unnamed protein product, partial [Polarella glacialis]